jgi:ComF family protein
MRFDLPWKGLLDWLLPVHCCGCNQTRVTPEQPLCYSCLAELSHTAYDPNMDPGWKKIFWGRIPLQNMFCGYPLKSGSILQQTIHQLKYHHRPGIGRWLGKMAAIQLTKQGTTWDMQGLIPLPLHPAKKRKRGYNQAEEICRGISAVTGIPVWNNVVIRNRFTPTQTRKDRGERWENMVGKFSLQHWEKATGKPLLLVDDVITTGATLEACGETLLKIPGSNLSIFALAHTETSGC